MNQRLDMYKAAPAAIDAAMGLEHYVTHCGLEPVLVELVKTRASQINGCAFCLWMHTRDARKAGESEERLYLLNAWEEAPHYSERERAALAWTEALTLLPQSHVPDAVYERARAQFTETELVNLSLLVGAINVWNRLAVAFRKAVPHQPAREA